MTLATEPPFIRHSFCECKAGKGNCSHAIGLLYLLAHYQKMNCKSVPPVESKTSLPQTWHVPSRRKGVAPQTAASMTVNKISQPAKNQSCEVLKKKRKMNTSGVNSKLYCPVKGTIPAITFVNSLISNLNKIQSNAQLLKLLPPTVESTFPLTTTLYGDVPYGCVLSYQVKEMNRKPEDIINIPNAPPYPDFTLPDQATSLNTVLDQMSQDILDGLQITADVSKDVEFQTRRQSETQLWYDSRKQRLTSSCFKRICSRRKDFESLAKQLVNQKNIQTQAIKHGIETEPEAAKKYGEITRSNVLLCGLVINPTAPHLGTSPDRRVYDPTAMPPFGLLEIKCTLKESFADVGYIVYKEGEYKLKRCHDYYYQVIGQMALTGSEWCDFFVYSANDYHLERIHFDLQHWKAMKDKLDLFFHDYYLPVLKT